jgi:hypothetical protein
MPNLSDGWAIVIAAFISVGGIVLTMLFNWFHRKADFEEKLYFEGFQRRIAVYEDVISMLSMMTTNKEFPVNISGREVRVKMSNYAHMLDTLIVRLSLLGSPASIKILHLFRFQLYDFIDDDIDLDDVTYASHVYAGLRNAIKNVLSEFTESARTETPIKIVDTLGKRTKMVNKQDHADNKKREKNYHE